ncbi:MAG: RidA family protein [Sphingomonadales bacterium]|jgi:enamine deaminase RidA (YjgF/YER057c/UK114 family)|uniref:RidA family protein n=1 Tax=Sphingorhabdus sp. TaxID=1902408 RepID=UPI0039BC9DA7|nr:RidA family protein [Sphingomonadaceae bacterium]MCE2830200.1 RidA family protein [Sphingomonadales bacterium]
MNKKHIPSGFQFPDAWQVDNVVYLSGQVSVDVKGEIIGRDDIALQTKTTLENVRRVLEKAGSGLEQLVKINTYLVYRGSEEDFPDFWAAMNAARLPFIPDPAPAATAMLVAGLAHPDFLIEIDGIATLR